MVERESRRSVYRGVLTEWASALWSSVVWAICAVSWLMALFMWPLITIPVTAVVAFVVTAEEKRRHPERYR